MGKSLGRISVAAILLLVLNACAVEDDSGESAESVSPSVNQTSPAPQSPADAEEKNNSPQPTATSSDGALEGGELPDFSEESESSTQWPEAERGPDSAELGLYLSDIRVGDHADFERIVFEHSGSGMPGYSVNYVDEAIADPLGEPLEINGTYILQIEVSGVTTPEEFPENALDGDDVLDLGAEGSTVQEVRPAVPFEGRATYYIGLDEQRDFRVHKAEDPTRIVVDIEG